MSRGGLVALALVAAGCGTTATAPTVERPRATADTPAPASIERCDPREYERLGGHREAYAAAAKRTTTAYARPRGGVVARFARRNANRVTTIFGVLGVVRNERCEPEWYRVQLPVRPNGATGYVRAADVETYRVETRIAIDLSDRRITFFRSGKPFATVTAAVGSSATPTPVGRYYVNQRLLSLDPAGPYGPGAIGISAFSPVLTGWAQGGPIAIHGTNQPWSIGRPATNGCLRVPNRVLERLFHATPNGTPVVIRA